jgi:hypothetical protein
LNVHDAPTFNCVVFPSLLLKNAGVQFESESVTDTFVIASLIVEFGSEIGDAFVSTNVYVTVNGARPDVTLAVLVNVVSG